MLSKISKGVGGLPPLSSLIPSSHTFLKGLVLVSGVLSVLAIRQCQSIRALCWVVFSELLFVFEKILSIGFSWKSEPICVKEDGLSLFCQKIASDSGDVDQVIQQKDNRYRIIAEAVAAFGLGCLSQIYTRSNPK